MKIELTDENVLDLLFFNIISIDGSISAEEITDVESFLKREGYTKQHFSDVVNYLNTLPTIDIQEILSSAVTKAASYPKSNKNEIISILSSFAEKDVCGKEEVSFIDSLISQISITK